MIILAERGPIMINDYSGTYPFESKRPWLSSWHPAISKEVTLYFQSDQKLCRRLEMIALKKDQPVSLTITDILQEYVKSHEESIKRYEKRRYERKAVSAITRVTNLAVSSSEPIEGLVLDLSLGGLCVSLPKTTAGAIGGPEKEPRFKATFVVPEFNKPVTMLCEPKWSMPSGGNVHMGASFVDGDFLQYQTLQQFLIQ